MRGWCTAVAGAAVMAAGQSLAAADVAPSAPGLDVCIVASTTLTLSAGERDIAVAEANVIWQRYDVHIRWTDDADENCGRKVLVKPDTDAISTEAADESAVGWVPFVEGRARRLILLRVARTRRLISDIRKGSRPTCCWRWCGIAPRRCRRTKCSLRCGPGTVVEEGNLAQQGAPAAPRAGRGRRCRVDHPQARLSLRGPGARGARRRRRAGGQSPLPYLGRSPVSAHGGHHGHRSCRRRGPADPAAVGVASPCAHRDPRAGSDRRGPGEPTTVRGGAPRGRRRRWH